MKPWGDAEISRFMFRRALFMRRGLQEAAAEALADRLAARDADRDDRRVCVECSHWQASRTCFKRLATSPLQLIRCRGFEWAKP